MGFQLFPLQALRCQLYLKMATAGIGVLAVSVFVNFGAIIVCRLSWASGTTYAEDVARAPLHDSGP
eukprot:411996-Amphidinium_carterae.1